MRGPTGDRLIEIFFLNLWLIRGLKTFTDISWIPTDHVLSDFFCLTDSSKRQVGTNYQETFHPDCLLLMTDMFTLNPRIFILNFYPYHLLIRAVVTADLNE